MTQAAHAASKVSVFVGISLDGFIAREDGALDWLTGSGEEPDGSEGAPEDHGYAAFIADIDAIVMGRATFDKVLSFDKWFYGDMPVFVLSHRELPKLPFEGAKVEALSGAPADVVAQLARRGLHRLYVDGGQTVQAFLAGGLVDDIVLSRLPVLIGRGIPLFGPLPHDVHLDHVSTKVLAGGMVQSTYHVQRP